MNRSVKIGNIGEEFVINLFNNYNILAEKESDINKKYDHDLVCKIGKTKFTCEIKFDSMACQTNNLAIEYRNCKQDKNSGLYVTTANLWIHLIKDGDNITCWAINTNKLKEYVKNNEPYKNIQKAGDGNADLKLYKIDSILPLFSRLDTLNEKKIKETILELLKEGKNE